MDQSLFISPLLGLLPLDLEVPSEFIQARLVAHMQTPIKLFFLFLLFIGLVLFLHERLLLVELCLPRVFDLCDFFLELPKGQGLNFLLVE